MSSKSASLPPALKSLLKQPTFTPRLATSSLASASPSPAARVVGRPAHPQTPPPPAHLSKVFRALDDEAQSKGVGWGEWLSIATATLVTLNSPASLQALHRHALPVHLPLARRLERACLMREVGLKCIGFIGIPKVINNLAALRAAVDEDAELAAKMPNQPRRKITPEMLPSVHHAADALWDDIYQPHSRKLVDILARSHPDLPVFIIEGEYGPLFSTPASFRDTPSPSSATGEPYWEVGRLRTSLVAISALRAQGGVGPQVTSHVWGLLKSNPDVSSPAEWRAPQEGETDAEVERRNGAARWLATEEGALWVVQTVDGLCEAIEGYDAGDAGRVAGAECGAPPQSKL